MSELLPKDELMQPKEHRCNDGLYPFDYYDVEEVDAILTVLTAERDQERKKRVEAEQFAMRQGNSIRKLEKTIDELNDVIVENGI